MFNYKKAWKEVAAPAFMSLPTNILQLIWRVHTEASYIKHQRNLHLEWPNDSLEKEFHNLQDKDLSYAAHVVVNTGHWHPGYDDWMRPIARQETHWRFSLYADQVLREKLKVPRLATPNGHIYEVVDGLLRSTIGIRKVGYNSTIIGLATHENLTKAKKIEKEYNRHPGGGPGGSEKWFEDMSKCILLQKEACYDYRIIDQTKFME